MTAAGTSDPPTSSGGEEGADTTGSDPTAESTAGPPDPSTSAAPAEEPLQNAAQTACDLPLWCYYSPDVSNPAGGPIWIFECFESSLTPPLEVVEVNFVVPVRPAGLQAVDFQVRARNGDRPGEVIDQEVVQPASIQEGDNTLVPGWDPIDTTSFCVGFYTDLVDAAGGIGIAADTDSAIQDVSWIQLQKGGGCQYDLVDVMDASPTLVPTGNWCLDIVVREAP
jgi:hypothetical protein